MPGHVGCAPAVSEWRRGASWRGGRVFGVGGRGGQGAIEAGAGDGRPGLAGGVRVITVGIGGVEGLAGLGVEGKLVDAVRVEREDDDDVIEGGVGDAQFLLEEAGRDREAEGAVVDDEAGGLGKHA